MRNITIFSILIAVLLVVGCTITGKVVKVDTVNEEPATEVVQEPVVNEPVQEVQPEEVVEAAPIEENKLTTGTGTVVKTRLQGYVIRLDRNYVDRIYFDESLNLEIGDRVQFDEDSEGNLLNLRKISESSKY